MARRVNTKFVVMLGALLVAGAAVVVVLVVIPRLRLRDPVYLTKQAQLDEKTGNLKSAMWYYAQAAAAAAKVHAEGADALFCKTGDLAMELSGKTTEPLEGRRLYDTAKSQWSRALTENSRYLPAHKKLIEEEYKTSSFLGRVQDWTELENHARKLTELDPTYIKAFTYLAAARLAQAQHALSMGTVDPVRFSNIEEVVQKAITMDPQAPTPVVIHADLLQTQALQARSANDMAEAQKLFDAAAASLRAYLEKNPGEPEVSSSLARMLWNKKQLDEKPKPEDVQKLNDEALKVMVDAVAAHPNDVHLVATLAGMYGDAYPDRAEEVLKNLVAANPDDPDSSVSLARFFQARGKQSDAIAAYKNVLQHPKPGGGIILWQNIQREIDSVFAISWLYMDLAEKAGLATSDGQEAFAQANVYADRLRTGQASRALQDLADGRLQLLKNNLLQAISYLLRADAVFGKGDASRSQWREVKMLLCQAYDRKTEWGNELRYLDEIQKVYPKMAWVLMQRARVLIKVARYNEALAVVDPIANPKADDHIPQETQREALRLAASAHLGMGNTKKYDEIINSLGGVEAMLSLASNQIADGNFEVAIEELKQLLVDHPDNESALIMTVVAYLRMGPDHKADAHAALQRALDKYPNNPQLQRWSVMIDQAEGDPLTTQIEAIKAISDDLVRNMSMAQLYGQPQFMNRDQEIVYLDAAVKVLEERGLEQSKEMLGRVADRVFMLNLQLAVDARTKAADAATRAAAAKDAAEKKQSLEDKAKWDTAYDKYWEQAKLYVQKAERMNLDGADGKLYLGRMQFAQGSDARRSGLMLLEQTAAAQPDNSTAHTVLGQAYYDLGRYDKALEEFRLAIQQKPDNILALRKAIELLIRKNDEQSVRDAQNYLQLALQFSSHDQQLRGFLDLVGEPNAAIREREAIRKAQPDDVDNIRRLAFLYVRVKQPKAAIELLRPLYDKNREDLPLADTLARLYRDANEINEALVLYDHFIGSSDPVVRFDATIYFGDLYRSLGKYDQAIATFKDAVGQQPPGRDDAQRRLGNLYFELDDMQDAELVYRELYKQSGKNDVRVAQRLTESLIWQDKFAEADEMLAALLKLQPNDPDGLTLRGLSLFRQKKYSQAFDSFNAVLKAHPNHIDALHYRALAQYTAQGDLDQAINDLLAVRERSESLLTSGRGNVLFKGRILLARVYRMARRYGEAADEYEGIIKDLQPNSPALRTEYAQFLMVLAEVTQRLSPDNRDDFAQMVRVVKPVPRLAVLLSDSAARYPDQPAWLVMEGNLLMLVNNRVMEAQRKYEEAFRKSKESPVAASAYLGSLLQTRNYEEVIALSTRLIGEQPPNGDYYIKRGMAYAALNKTSESMADFKTAMGMVGQNLQLYLAVARAAAAALPGEAFMAELQGRVTADPSDMNARIALGEMYLVRNHGSEAVSVLAPLVDDPKNGPNNVLILRMMAMSRYQARDLDGAYKAYSELLKIAPDDLESLNNFAFLVAEDLKKPKEALPYAARAVKILRTGNNVDIAFVNNGNVYDTYGWVLYLSGDTAGAITELRRALQIEPFCAGYLHLAKALAKDDQLVEAGKAINEGVRLAKEKKDPVLSQLEALQKELGVK